MNINNKSDKYLDVVKWDDLTKEQQESGEWIKIDENTAKLDEKAREKAMMKEIEALNKAISGVKQESK